MEKEKNKKKMQLLNIMFVSMLLMGSATGIYFSISNTQENGAVENIDLPTVEEKEEKTWNLLPLASDASPATSGVINIYTIDSDAGGLDYDADIGEADAYVYEHGDADGFSDGEELAETTPFDTGFDICIEYQFTGAQAVDGGAWNVSRVKAFCNCTDLSISSQEMEKSTAFFTTSGTGAADTGVINFYLKDADGGAGTGFVIGIDETFSIDDIKIYYYG